MLTVGPITIWSVEESVSEIQLETESYSAGVPIDLQISIGTWSTCCWSNEFNYARLDSARSQ